MAKKNFNGLETKFKKPIDTVVYTIIMTGGTGITENFLFLGSAKQFVNRAL